MERRHKSWPETFSPVADKNTSYKPNATNDNAMQIRVILWTTIILHTQPVCTDYSETETKSVTTAVPRQRK
eukprot:scaffold130639_cov39-Attheya_sp.AAC.1